MLDQPDIRARIQATVAWAVIDLPKIKTKHARQESFAYVQGEIGFALEIGAITSEECADYLMQICDAHAQSYSETILGK